MQAKVLVVEQGQLPEEPLWLSQQVCPVIAYGEPPYSTNADVVVSDEATARKLASRVEQYPLASLALVQVLRAGESLSAMAALEMESLAYATLQAGPEFSAWLAQRKPQLALAPAAEEGEAIQLSRKSNCVSAVMNRPQTRNAMTIEMRDALVEALQLLEQDSAISEFKLSGNGACFCVGGALWEFGSAPDVAKLP